ncbi:unnamed protein product [Rhizopus stolonifer]
MKINQDKARKAFKALYKHESENEGKEETVWLMISTFENNALINRNPAKILLKHGCYTPGVRQCLLVRASQQAYKDKSKRRRLKAFTKL